MYENIYIKFTSTYPSLFDEGWTIFVAFKKSSIVTDKGASCSVVKGSLMARKVSLKVY